MRISYQQEVRNNLKEGVKCSAVIHNTAFDSPYQLV